MGTWNTHGMDQDDEEVEYALNVLGLSSDELQALVEHCRREQWLWTQVARGQSGQRKRKSNLIAKHMGLRMEKWIDLAVQAEVAYETEFGEFAEKEEE